MVDNSKTKHEFRNRPYYWETRINEKFPLLVGIVFLAVATRFVHAVLTTSWIFSPDKHWWAFGHEMGQIAASLAVGNGFSWPESVPYRSIYSPGQPTAWMPPAYPILMALAFRAFGVFTNQAAIAVEVFQTVVSALTCTAVYLLGKRLFNATVGLVAALLLAVYPAAIHFAVEKAGSTSLFACCLLLIILLFLQRAEHSDWKGAIVLGVLLGFSALLDPVVIGTYPFAFIWLFLKGQGDRHTTIKMILISFFVCLLTVSPWIARNYVVFGEFVAIKSNLGNELFKGNNEFATGHFKLRSGQPLTKDESLYLRGLNEASRNRFLFGKAITFIKEHPLRFAKLTVSRFIYYWTISERSIRKMWVPLTAYLGVLILAIIGLILNKAKSDGVYLVLLFLISFPLPYYFTVVGLFRYRFPLEPLLMIFAAYTLQWVAWRWGILPNPAPTVTSARQVVSS